MCGTHLQFPKSARTSPLLQPRKKVYLNANEREKGYVDDLASSPLKKKKWMIFTNFSTLLSLTNYLDTPYSRPRNSMYHSIVAKTFFFFIAASWIYRRSQARDRIWAAAVTYAAAAAVLDPVIHWPELLQLDSQPTAPEWELQIFWVFNVSRFKNRFFFFPFNSIKHYRVQRMQQEPG